MSFESITKLTNIPVVESGIKRAEKAYTKLKVSELLSLKLYINYFVSWLYNMHIA